MTASLRRLIHVHGGDGAAIDLDGPALRVTHRDRSPVWMPIERASDLVVQGRLALGPGVVESALAAGVSIRWLAQDGRPLGEVLPNAPEDPTDATRLDRLLLQADWRRSYLGWRRRQAIWDAARAAGRYIRVSDLAGVARPGLLARQLLAPTPVALELFNALGDLLLFDARQTLLRQGWPIERVRAPRPGPCPARDIATAMRWETLRLLRRDPPPAPVGRLAWYARHRSALQDCGRCTFDSFRRWLVDRTGATA